MVITYTTEESFIMLLYVRVAYDHELTVAYTMAQYPAKAMKAYEKAHAWRELFTMAKEQDLDEETIAAMVERVTDHLSSRGKNLEAAQVFMDYANDVDSAVEVLSKGLEFAEAQRLTALHDRSELIEKVIHPGLEDAQEELS